MLNPEQSSSQGALNKDTSGTITDGGSHTEGTKKRRWSNAIRRLKGKRSNSEPVPTGPYSSTDQNQDMSIVGVGQLNVEEERQKLIELKSKFGEGPKVKVNRLGTRPGSSNLRSYSYPEPTGHEAASGSPVDSSNQAEGSSFNVVRGKRLGKSTDDEIGKAIKDELGWKNRTSIERSSLTPAEQVEGSAPSNTQKSNSEPTGDEFLLSSNVFSNLLTQEPEDLSVEEQQDSKLTQEGEDRTARLGSWVFTHKGIHNISAGR